jgi:hypothetical protein
MMGLEAPLKATYQHFYPQAILRASVGQQKPSCSWGEERGMSSYARTSQHTDRAAKYWETQ